MHNCIFYDLLIYGRIEKAEFELLRERSLLTPALSVKDRESREVKIAKMESKLVEDKQTLADAIKRHAQLIAAPIAVPVDFKLTYIDFQTNKYVTLNDIVQIFSDLVIETHGTMYCKTMRDELQDLSLVHREAFYAEFGETQRTEKERLAAMMEHAYNESSIRLENSIATNFMKP